MPIKSGPPEDEIHPQGIYPGGMPGSVACTCGGRKEAAWKKNVLIDEIRKIEYQWWRFICEKCCKECDLAVRVDKLAAQYGDFYQDKVMAADSADSISPPPSTIEIKCPNCPAKSIAPRPIQAQYIDAVCNLCRTGFRIDKETGQYADPTTNFRAGQADAGLYLPAKPTETDSFLASGKNKGAKLDLSALNQMSAEILTRGLFNPYQYPTYPDRFTTVAQRGVQPRATSEPVLEPTVVVEIRHKRKIIVED